MNSPEQQRARWEKLRRLLLALVAVARDDEPDGAWTLDVRIVAREQSQRQIAS